MKVTSILVSFSAIMAVPQGVTAQICGGAGAVTVDGSTTVEPITTELATRFTAKCPKTTFTIAKGGSSAGANRVCGVPTAGTPVDIGNMSRNWKATEATQTLTGTYKCVQGGAAGREVIQVPVALDGVTVAIKRNGDLTACFTALGNSLKLAELRWLFSSAPANADVSFPDGDTAVHKWNELNAACPNEVVKLRIPGSTYGTHSFFVEVVLTPSAVGMRVDANTATFADNSPALQTAILNTPFAIGFMGYSFYNLQDTTLFAVGVDGAFPSATSLAADTYKPLGRSIFSNYWNDATALAKTKCFNDFHFTKTGAAYIAAKDLLPIAETQWAINKSNVPGKCECPRCGFFARLFGRCKRCP